MFDRVLLKILLHKLNGFMVVSYQASWEIFTPLLHRIDDGEFKPIPYKPGSRGPAEADQLLEQAGYVQTHGYIWIPPTL